MELGDMLTLEQEQALLEFESFLAIDDPTAIMALKEVEANMAKLTMKPPKPTEAPVDPDAPEPADVQIKLVSTLRRKDIKRGLVADANIDWTAPAESGTAEENADDDDDDDDDDEDEDEDEAAATEAAPAPKKRPAELTASPSTLASLQALPTHPGGLAPPAAKPAQRKQSIFAAAVKKTGRSLGALLKSNKAPTPTAAAVVATQSSNPDEDAKRILEQLKTDTKKPPKSQLYEVCLFSLSTAKTSVPYLVEAGADGFIIRDYDTGNFLREFPLRYIQSMHFIINNRTKERLFVLDYIRTDESAKGKHLVGRLVLSSEDNETIFNNLKQAMIAVAKKKMAAQQAAAAQQGAAAPAKK